MARCRCRHAGPVPDAPLIARWEAAGESWPFIAPVPKTHTMPAVLGIVSGGLTVQLIEALRDWPGFNTSLAKIRTFAGVRPAFPDGHVGAAAPAIWLASFAPRPYP